MDVNLIILIINEVNGEISQMKVVNTLMKYMNPHNQKLLISNTIMRKQRGDIFKLFKISISYHLSNIIHSLEDIVLEEYKISLNEYFIDYIVDNAIKINDNSYIKQLQPNIHISIHNIILSSLKYNNMNMIKWIVEQPWFISNGVFNENLSSLNSKLFLHAAKYNNSKLLNILVRNTNVLKNNMYYIRVLNLSIYYAASRGYFCIFKLIHEKIPYFRNDVMDLACLSNNFNMITWLFENGYNFTDYAFINAASIGSYVIIRYLLNIITEDSSYKFNLNKLINNEKIILAAIQSGNIKLVKYLYDLGFEIKNIDCMEIVIKNGDLEMLIFLNDIGVKYEDDKKYEYIMAAKGYVDMIKYVTSSLNFHKASNILKYAIRYCNINVIEYIGSLGFSATDLLTTEIIKKEILFAIRFKRESKHIIRYFSNRKELFTISHIIAAAYSYNFEIVRLIFDNGKFMDKLNNSYMFKNVSNKKKKEFFIWAMYKNYSDIFLIFKITYIIDISSICCNKDKVALYLTRNKSESIYSVENICFYNAIMIFAMTTNNDLELIKWVVRNDINFDIKVFIDISILIFRVIKSLPIVKYICHNIITYHPNFNFNILYNKTRYDYIQLYLAKNYIQL